MDVDAERILLEPFGVGRHLQNDGEDRAPTLGGCQRTVGVAALHPFDPEAALGGADHGRYFDSDLDPADLGEWIVAARVVIERYGAFVGDVVVGFEPVLSQHDWIRRPTANLFNE